MLGDDADVFLQSLKIKPNKENTSSPTYQTKYIVKFIEMWESQNKDNATIDRLLELLQECLAESDYMQSYKKIEKDVLGKNARKSILLSCERKLTTTI